MYEVLVSVSEENHLIVKFLKPEFEAPVEEVRSAEEKKQRIKRMYIAFLTWIHINVVSWDTQSGTEI